MNAGAGLDYAVSERSNIGADYNYQKTDFERSQVLIQKLTAFVSSIDAGCKTREM